MAMVEISGYPPVGEVVDAWVNVAWVLVFWDGSIWRFYSTQQPVPAVITHWRYAPIGV